MIVSALLVLFILNDYGNNNLFANNDNINYNNNSGSLSLVVEAFCESEIYCKGTLLEVIQDADLFNDSKVKTNNNNKKNKRRK